MDGKLGPHAQRRVIVAHRRDKGLVRTQNHHIVGPIALGIQISLRPVTYIIVQVFITVNCLEFKRKKMMRILMINVNFVLSASFLCILFTTCMSRDLDGNKV